MKEKILLIIFLAFFLSGCATTKNDFKRAKGILFMILESVYKFLYTLLSGLVICWPERITSRTIKEKEVCTCLKIINYSEMGSCEFFMHCLSTPEFQFSNEFIV